MRPAVRLPARGQRSLGISVIGITDRWPPTRAQLPDRVTIIGLASQQTLRNLAEYQPVARGREVDVAGDEQAPVPVFMGVLLGEERREKIDETLTILGAEIPPDGNLAAVAIVVRELRRPWIHRNGERNPALLEKIREFAHVLQGSGNAALDPQRGVGIADIVSRKGPARFLGRVGFRQGDYLASGAQQPKLYFDDRNHFVHYQ